ncbi:peptidoglycan-binding domain-containing protein [Streptomyces sp. NPDC002588]|uniref:peptidoglycan-binding domain-containing protein n=1 Tax=Streptomyces sp. NPDC002588 TaxID=3154419 RepID=UPI00332B0462
MRPNVLARTLVSLTAVAGIAAGTLAAAGTGYAAPAEQPAVSVQAAAAASYENFGLTIAEGKNVQNFLADYWGYTDDIDGKLGTNSWKAFQRCLKKYWGYTGEIDGDPGTNTIKALQRLLKNDYGYTGDIDGIAGSGTKAAFKRFAA